MTFHTQTTDQPWEHDPEHPLYDAAHRIPIVRMQEPYPPLTYGPEVGEEEPRTMRCTCGRFMKPEEHFSNDSPDSFYTIWTCRNCPRRDHGDYGGFPEYG